MDILEHVTKLFVAQSREILKDALVGIYLHGSAAMGCFHEKTSDIDLLAVVNTALSDPVKRQYMDMAVDLNAQAPKKGIELSIIREEVCKPFLYPTPFELHFSIAHLQWYLADPSDYIARMKGNDKDLAAHMMVLYHRGVCLYGKQITDVLEEPGREDYFDSIWNDIEHAKEDILTVPVYITLNLCRVLAYAEDGLILSKQEGGDWGLGRVHGPYRSVILQALEAYSSGRPMKLEKGLGREYAAFMMERIQKRGRRLAKKKANPGTNAI